MFIRNSPKLKGWRRELRRNQTDEEKVLWERLRGRRFYGLKFFRQYSVGPYVVDFCCPSLKLAIELDGGQHSCREQKEYDTNRTKHLKLHDIEVIRFWNNEVMQNIEGVLERITERITPPNLPLP